MDRPQKECKQILEPASFRGEAARKPAHQLLKKYLPLLLFGLLCAVFAFCTPNGESGDGAEANDSDSVGNSNQNSETTNPVLREARNNSLFNARKWLESDHWFLNRANPHSVSKHDKIIKKMARRYGFDWRMIAAQIFVESNFKNVSRSRAGALGLMQVLPSTAEFMGVDPDLLLEPEANIAVGCMYDQRMFSLWGKQTKDYENRLAFALASYNAGRGRVLRSYRAQDSSADWTTVHPDLPKETQKYVHKVYLKTDFYKEHLLP